VIREKSHRSSLTWRSLINGLRRSLASISRPVTTWINDWGRVIPEINGGTTAAVVQPRHQCKWVRRRGQYSAPSSSLRKIFSPSVVIRTPERTNRNVSEDRSVEFTGGNVHCICDLLHILYNRNLHQSFWQSELKGFVLLFSCDNLLIRLYQSCSPTNHIWFCYSNLNQTSTGSYSKSLSNFVLVHCQSKFQLQGD
jgi:hypothetical protein